MHAELPYGAWPSPLTADAVAAGVIRLAELRARAGSLAWLESRPTEGGRTVLVRRADDGARQDLTPAPYNVRSRVHEYGGGAWVPASGDLFGYFVNYADQNLFSVAADGAITQLTRGAADVRFADLCVDGGRQRLLAVCERHGAGSEPQNLLCAVAMAPEKIAAATHKQPQRHASASSNVLELHTGHDFYSSPRLSADGSRITFIVWDHPNMPWDGSQLLVADIDADGTLGPATTVAGGADESVIQPLWLPDGGLLFLSDRNGYWNLYRYDDGGVFCVLEDGADYGSPPWVFGLSEIVALGESHALLCRLPDQVGSVTATNNPAQAPSARCELVLTDTRSRFATPLGTDEPWQNAEYLCSRSAGSAAFIASYADRAPELVELDLRTHTTTTLFSTATRSALLAPAAVSPPQPIRFATRDGGHAYGYYYAPRNPAASAPRGDRPPLLVMNHGGPTAAAGTGLNYRVQYYTTRGWAVLDVDYRGSTGHGRAYHKALHGQWGLLDVSDCEDAVRQLAAAGLVDPARVAIRGGSAGGYTTLAALTTTSTFRAGASHYGIGDLHALARDTHKFESRYLDGLLGTEAALTDRSPINHIDRLSCPVIFFQGGEDKVVPPNQAQAMVAALRAKAIPVAYIEFPEEGHGFRAAANIVTTLKAEFAFFSRVFGIDAPDLVPLEVENL